MPGPADKGGSFPADRYRNPETALGGADAVPKTTYVTGEGTEPEGQKPAERRKGEQTGAGGRGILWTVIGIVAVLVVLTYFFGISR
jgi:hypothetical protein